LPARTHARTLVSQSEYALNSEKSVKRFGHDCGILPDSPCMPPES
jgi:hypothetical protein